MEQLTGRFLADFENFFAATRKAEVELKAMEGDANKVGVSLNRMVDNFGGRKLVQDATLVTEAVERIGGASKLTEAEQAKVNRTVAEAIAKYAALGQTAPTALQNLFDATKAAIGSTSSLNDHLQQIQRHVSTFSGDKIIQEAQQMARAIAEVGGASKLTASEQVRVNSVVTEAIAKYGVLGQKAPQALRDLAVATKAVIPLTDTLAAHAALVRQQFERFSGDKVIQDAHAMTRAIEQLGGASKLTASEQMHVNATVTEAMAKYAALGQTAPPAMLALANATRAVEQPTSRVNSYMNDLTNQVKATALGFISAQAVIGGVKAAFSTLTAFVGSSIESFAAAEASQKKLTTALQAQGMATPAITAQYDKLATTFQKTTAYSDDLVTEMQALLVQVGNVMPSEMNSALTAATNLASGLGIDLRQATMLVGKAFEGETGTLKRYGIVIDEAKLKAGGMPVVLDAIQQRFGGQAAAEVETYAGRIKQLANEWDNLKEKVGGYIAQDAVLLAAMRNLGEAGKTAESGVTGWNVAMGVMAASTPGWLVALKNIHADLTPIAEAANSAAAAVKLIKPPDIYGAGGPAKPTGGPDPAVLVAQWTKEQAKAEAATKAAAEAAKQAAKAFREMADSMSGAKAISEANKQLDLIVFNMNRGIPLAKMTRENQDAINKSMSGAIEVYRLMGTEVPPAIKAVYFATLDMSKGVPIVAGLSSEFAKLGAIIKVLPTWVPSMSGLTAEFGRIGETVKLQVIPPTQKWQSHLDELSRSLAQLSQISGDTFGGIVRDLASLVSATDAATKGFASFKAGKKEGFNLSGILEMSTGILGIASAAIQAGKAIKNMFFGSAGRDLVKDFVGSMGGFDALREELTVLGAEGERLWVALTQGVGKNNPEQAQAAIEAITAALAKQKDVLAGVLSPLDQVTAAGFQTQAELQGIADKAQTVYDTMRESGLFTAATLEDAWKQYQAALEKAVGVDTGAQKALDAVKALDDELKGLFKSIENEAPEEIMGVIEANTRAQIAGIQKERDAAQLALEQTAGDAAKTAEEAAQLIEKTLSAHDFRVKVKIDLDDPSGILSGKTAGGILRGGNGTGTVSSGAGGDQTIVVQTILDGEVLAESLATTLKRQGVR